MARLISSRALVQLLRAGDLRARLRATQDAQAAIRLQVVSAALATGVLDALAEAPSTSAELATRTGATDVDLLEAFLRVAAAGGLLRRDGVRWRLARAGCAVVEDDLVRASYEGFGGFHTDLYRQLQPVLAGGTRRRDVAERGQVIARMSAGFDPFVHTCWYGRSPAATRDGCSTSGAVRGCSWPGCSRRSPAPPVSGSTSTPALLRWPSAPCGNAGSPPGRPSR
jgi:hypothetical protein